MDIGGSFTANATHPQTDATEIHLKTVTFLVPYSFQCNLKKPAIAETISVSILIIDAFMNSQAQLSELLFSLDNRGYKAYKQIKGEYDFQEFTLIIDYVQGDPFAAPTQCSVIVPQAIAQFPEELYSSLSREIALRDYLSRQFALSAREFSGFRGTGKSGLIQGVEPVQEVFERTSVFIDDADVEVRFWVGLPAKGRSILGRQAEEMLCYDLPQIIKQSLLYHNLDHPKIQQHVETIEDAEWLRTQLERKGLVAFIADGAILPRRSGIDPHPLTENAIPFQSTPELAVSFDRPNLGKITGMGIPKGITLIVGGGYHGKSTLLKAIELGVYNHIPGDGREWVITDVNTVSPGRGWSQHCRRGYFSLY